jgi:hypothetical protein
MTLSVWFWLIWVIALLFGLWSYWPRGENPVWGAFGNGLILWILLGLLGWRVFGSPLQGG